ncbi:MAG: hypothetical protein ABI263_03840 [Gelidibacter sp.]
MNDKKHIDRLFQEKFKNFEVTPDDAIWDNIHNALHDDKRKRRVIPIWWLSAGVAAMLVLLLTVGNIFNPSDTLNTPENSVVGTETTRSSSKYNQKTSKSDQNNGVEENNRNSTDNGNAGFNAIANTEPSENAATTATNDIVKKIRDRSDKTTTQLTHEASDKKKTTHKTNSQEDINAFQKDKTGIPTPNEKEVFAKNKPHLPQLSPNTDVINQGHGYAKTVLEYEKERTPIAKVKEDRITKDTELVNEYEDIIASHNEDESIEDAIAKANLINEEEKEKEEQPNRWNISPNVAPVYFNSLGKGSSIDSQFVNNSKSGDVNMSYGISGSYAINDHIKIRAGVNKVDLGYSTEGVTALKDVHSFNVNSESSELRNINFNRQAKADAYMSTSSINKESAPQFVVSNAKGSLEQNFGYIEVPLEIEYNLINSKFGLNVIGGFSTLFLNTNEIYSVLDNTRSLLGDANNINKTSYSANFGLGLNYNISQTLKLNLEPMFKYQINTFNNTSGDFRPYFIGVYSGFSFKF